MKFVVVMLFVSVPFIHRRMLSLLFMRMVIGYHFWLFDVIVKYLAGLKMCYSLLEECSIFQFLVVHLLVLKNVLNYGVDNYRVVYYKC